MESKRPILLCGLGRVGWRVLEFLRAAGMPVVVVDTTCEDGDPRLAGARLVQGDCRQREVLEEAGVGQARGVLLLTSDDLVNISTALMVRRLNGDVRVVIRMFNQNLLNRLGKAVRNVVALSTSTLTAPLLALTAVTGQALGTFCLDDEDGRRQVAELTVGVGSPLRGLTIRDAMNRQRGHALAHLPSSGSGGRYLAEVQPDTILEAGDRLVLCAASRELAEGVLADEEALPHRRWASLVRRFGRVAWRTLGEVDLPVKLCTSVLVTVVIVSTLVFHFSVDRQTVANALFRTISLIATGADMHGEEFSNSTGLKFFVSGLRLFGAALIAVFTAIVTNYLLRARLGGALEVRRIPDSGHVIVCGLGNIGFRVVEELVRLDEPVVAIELAVDGRFVATTRRLGVAVVAGDATVREVMRQAHAANARAVVAVTTSDLVNLEIALLARELNPKQRVVVRMSDPVLAETLREAANIRLALSIPTLAAPSFVAALFGDRVLSVFWIGDRLMAVIDVLVQDRDILADAGPVATLAAAYRLLPLAVVGADGKPAKDYTDRRLGVGDRLIAITLLQDMERLLGRQQIT
jgi:Trk K+ transport system NAD-binding subunit